MKDAIGSVARFLIANNLATRPGTVAVRRRFGHVLLRPCPPYGNTVYTTVIDPVVRWADANELAGLIGL